MIIKTETNPASAIAAVVDGILSVDFFVDIPAVGLPFALVFSPTFLFWWALIFRIFRSFAFGIPRPS
jgi:hypothetical protein